MTHKKDAIFHLKPHVLFVMTLAAVFSVELLVMFLLPFLPRFSPVIEAFLDACLLSLLVVPFLFYFFLKPLSRNIELRKQKEIERNNLQEIDTIKNEFISTAAHELRTPVATIMGYTELLSDHGPIGPISDVQRGEFLDEIYASSERLNKIVDDVLDVSRIESGQKIALNKQSLSIKQLLEKVVKRLSLKASHHLVLEVSPGIPERFDFDDDRIDQVLGNLIGNAIKYSPEQSTITVVAVADADRCKITVADQGIGMSAEQQARVFEKFYRADTSDTSVGGLGLGMSIVKQIVEDHDGTIVVESVLGEGTRVCFSLPVQQD